MGLALLYTYRAQRPSQSVVSLSTAIAEVNGGQARNVVIQGEQATLTLRSGEAQQANIGGSDVVVRSVPEYNASHPNDKVDLSYEPRDNSLNLIGSVVLSLLPVFLIGGFFFYMMRQAQARDRQRRV